MCLRGEVGMSYQEWETKSNQGSSGSFFNNMFFVGATAGLIAGLLLAPKPGKESRGMVKERFSSVRDKVMRRGSSNSAVSEKESLESAVRADYLH
jgi:gas vesicle protein